MTDSDAGLDSLPQPGTVIAGKYEVQSLLGKGGMGAVMAAKHLELGKQVALKFLLPEAMELPNATERFMREARAAVAIHNPHVARILDVSRLESGEPYMVMELLAGEDLSKLLRRVLVLPIDEAVDMMLQACEALAEAHGLGIVHRDLKPGNLFVSTRQDGSRWVKVLDFGLSKVTAGKGIEVGDGSLTAPHMIAGSPHYQAPEQYRSLKDVTPVADIWSLGAILYRMLTGFRPFTGDNLTSLCVSVVTDDPDPPREIRPEIPVELEAVILACLEKDPERRIPNIGELTRRLASFASSQGRSSVRTIASIVDDDSISVPDQPPVSAEHLSCGAAPHAATEPASSSTPALPLAPPSQSEGPSRTQATWSARPATHKVTVVAIVVAFAAIVVAALSIWRLRGDPPAPAAIPSPPSPASATAPATDTPTVIAATASPTAAADAGSSAAAARVTAISGPAAHQSPTAPEPSTTAAPSAATPPKDPLDKWD